MGGRLEIAALSPVGRQLRAGVETVDIFASLTSRRLLEKLRVALLELRCQLLSGCADWVVLKHSTNVNRVTRGKNIFNNKIYIGNLASTDDVRCPSTWYLYEYQEVPAT